MHEALVIGASPESIYAIKTAQKLGFYVIAMDGSAQAAGLKYANESFVLDISRPDNILDVLSKKVPEVILPVPVGRVLTTIGKLNSAWGLLGVNEQAADLCTDKYLFHRVLAEKNLRSNKCYLLSEVDDEPSLLNNFHFPVVCKPRFGSGSRGVSLFNSYDDFESYCSNLPEAEKETLLVEEAFQGQEYGVDGMAVRGIFHPLLLRKKCNTPPPVCQCLGYETVSRKNDLYGLVQKRLQSIIEAIGLDNAILHADIMICGEEINTIELSARPSGHGIHDRLLPFSTGLNPIEEFLKLVNGDDDVVFSRSVEPMYMGFFAFSQSRVVKTPDRKYIKEKYDPVFYQPLFTEGTCFGEVLDGSITQRGSFILKGSGDEVFEKARELIEEFELEQL